MPRVASAMRTTTIASTRLRPIRSPRGPKKNPPSGRMKNATANTANVLSNAAVPFDFGKNSRAM